MLNDDDIRESYTDARRARPESWNALKQRGIDRARQERSLAAHALIRRLFAPFARFFNRRKPASVVSQSAASQTRVSQSHEAENPSRSSALYLFQPVADWRKGLLDTQDEEDTVPISNRSSRGAVRITPAQIALIKDSWQKVLPIAETAASLFYGRLFAIAPDLKPLFAETDMAEQKSKLLIAIDGVVRNLENLDKITTILRALGHRHAGYGVQPEHYDVVGAALLWTLEQGLDSAWTDDVADAWKAAYKLIAAAMQDGEPTVPRALAA